MKKILVLSGKGGTGKTTVTAAMIEFSMSRAFADCDVDAPNLHLLQSFDALPEEREFIGSEKAVIDKEKCLGCGKCRENCKFNAIKIKDGKYEVYEYGCEGCGVCELVCPRGAVSLCDDIAGKTMLYRDERVFSTALLKMGRGNSGKLVTEVKKNLFTNDRAKNEKTVFIDGSPGIGCPVIASSSGVDIVLMVTEPSVSGISDMERVIKVIRSFNIKIFVCINKADISREQSEKIIKWCKAEGIEFAGEIPYDSIVSEGVNNGRGIANVNCRARDAIYEVYKKVMKYAEAEV